MLETLDAMMLCQLMLKMNIASIWEERSPFHLDLACWPVSFLDLLVSTPHNVGVV